MIGSVLEGKYRVEREVARGGQAMTWLAKTPSGDAVLVKVLEFANVADWKGLELFEREIEVLRNLSHPGIPDYLDSFEGGEGASRSFYLVQEFFEGCTLQEAVEGKLLNGHDAERIFNQILEILTYLHGHSPPVVHRDIKPANILLDMDEGSVKLVDFGAVQVVTSRVTGGSTIVGSTGYMAPEQLMGKGVPASDLFALGANMVFILTGKAPSELPTSRMKVQWKSEVSTPVDDTFVALVDRLIEPHPQDRPASIADVFAPPSQQLVTLPKSDSPILRIDRPRKARCSVSRAENKLLIEIPSYQESYIGPVTFLLGSLACIYAYFATGLIFMLGLGAVGLLVTGLMAYHAYQSGLPVSWLVLSPEGFKFTKAGPGKKALVYEGALSDIAGTQAGRLSASKSMSDERELFIKINDDEVHLASYITTDEQIWLDHEIQGYLSPT